MKKVIVGILVVAAIFGLSWSITSGVVWLIFKCFRLQFSWKISTGIWLILMILRSVFNQGKK